MLGAMRLGPQKSLGRPFARLNVISIHFATSAALNPLLDQSSLPRFGAIEPIHVKPAIEHLVSSLVRPAMNV